MGGKKRRIKSKTPLCHRHRLIDTYGGGKKTLLTLSGSALPCRATTLAAVIFHGRLPTTADTLS